MKNKVTYLIVFQRQLYPFGRGVRRKTMGFCHKINISGSDIVHQMLWLLRSPMCAKTFFFCTLVRFMSTDRLVPSYVCICQLIFKNIQRHSRAWKK